MPSRRKLAEERRGRAGAMQARNFATCGSGIMLRRFPGSLRFMILAATAVVLAAPSAVAQTRAPSKQKNTPAQTKTFPGPAVPVPSHLTPITANYKHRRRRAPTLARLLPTFSLPVTICAPLCGTMPDPNRLRSSPPSAQSLHRLHRLQGRATA